jgi:hypothetical protein
MGSENVPVSAEWRKSSFSGSSGCVEVAFVDSLVLVRDTEDQLGGALEFSVDIWQRFVAGVKAGEFDPS